MLSFFAFILKEELKKRKTGRSPIASPYDLWDRFPKNSYVVLARDTKTGELKPADKKRYAKLASDSRYEKLELYSGN